MEDLCPSQKLAKTHIFETERTFVYIKVNAPCIVKINNNYDDCMYITKISNDRITMALAAI